MNCNPYQILKTVRVFVQASLLSVFLAGFFFPGMFKGVSVAFFWFDPLLLLMHVLSSGTVQKMLLLSLIPLILTLFLGRFFCGWLCPLGTINHFFSRVFLKSGSRGRPDQRMFSVKYGILLFLLTPALAGIHIWGWLDPFSLLSRSLTVFFPSIDFAGTKLSLVAQNHGMSGELRRYSASPFLIAAVFVFIIGLNAYSRRFFCNILCPLGAIYAVTARLGFFRLSPGPDCSACGICGEWCPSGTELEDKYRPEECFTCLNCAGSCPESSAKAEFALAGRDSIQITDFGRRSAVFTVAGGLFSAALFHSSLSRRGNIRHRFIRPPGALSEHDFLEKCARCGQCIQSCPTGFIQPSFTTAGLEGMWTPVVDARAGYCKYDCTLCTGACPAGALKELSLPEKKVFKIGTAVIDKNLCFTYSDGFTCTKCYDACPLKGTAIKTRSVPVNSFTGRPNAVQQIYIDADYCTGCGICQYVCPRTDRPGIFITSADEHRERETGVM